VDHICETINVTARPDQRIDPAGRLTDLTPICRSGRSSLAPPDECGDVALDALGLRGTVNPREEVVVIGRRGRPEVGRQTSFSLSERDQRFWSAIARCEILLDLSSLRCFTKTPQRTLPIGWQLGRRARRWTAMSLPQRSAKSVTSDRSRSQGVQDGCAWAASGMAAAVGKATVSPCLCSG
jgi:hypothetical protein